MGMQSQPQQSGKGGSGQPSGMGGYGQGYGAGSSNGFQNPAQQGSFFSVGGSNRPQFGTPMTTLPYQMPAGMQGPRTMDTGPYGGFGAGAPQIPNIGSGTLAPLAAGVGSAMGSTNPLGRTGGSMPSPQMPQPSQPLNYNGVSQSQQAMGMGFDPSGRFTFAPSMSGGSEIAQLAPGTAAMLGFRNNGQGQWVNGQGQVVGRV